MNQKPWNSLQAEWIWVGTTRMTVASGDLDVQFEMKHYFEEGDEGRAREGKGTLRTKLQVLQCPQLARQLDTG